MFTKEELLETPSLRIFDDEPLPKLNAEGISDLLFPNESRMLDIPVYVRNKTKNSKYFDCYVFKLIQPLESEVIIVANSLAGGKWDSFELSGSKKKKKEDGIRFIKQYLEKYITKNSESEVEVNMFAYEIEFNKRVVWIPVVDDEKDDDFDLDDDTLLESIEE